MPAIRRNGLEHLISDSQDIPTKYIISTEDDGTTKSTLRPNFVMCCKPDQLLLSWLLSTITESIICAVTHCTASLELLTVLEKIYSSQSMARSIVLRMQLHSTRKDNMIISEYCTKMRNLVTELVTARKIVSNEDLCNHIITGLDRSYESVLGSRMSPVIFCFKVGYTTDECWHIREEDFAPRNNEQQHQRAAFVVANEGVLETWWNLDSRTTNYVTNDLNNLSMRSEYKGNSFLMV